MDLNAWACSNHVPARSAYIHVPFCAHHCGYCNFTVIAGRNDLVDDYLQAIEREIALLPHDFQLDTLYFGGGTPSQLSCGQLEQLFAIVQKRLHCTEHCEVTFEVNPVDACSEKMITLAKLGVNRVSLGSQSFSSRTLELLERDHQGEDIARATEAVRDSGINAVALDLIFAVPGQTMAQWCADLAAALLLKPDHISTYGLTYEKGAVFFGRLLRGEIQAIDEEQERAMYLAAIDTLTSASFEHYEVSNFATANQRSRHNEVYWTGHDYLAFGPGAARYVEGRRETNHRSVREYLRLVLAGKSPVAESEQLDAEATARERLVFGLRRLEGVAIDAFAHNTGFSVEQLIAKPLDKFLGLKLLEVNAGHLRLTREGLLVSDSIWPEFL